jgi:hypothetical protein
MVTLLVTAAELLKECPGGDKKKRSSVAVSVF